MKNPKDYFGKNQNLKLRLRFLNYMKIFLEKIPTEFLIFLTEEFVNNILSAQSKAKLLKQK